MRFHNASKAISILAFSFVNFSTSFISPINHHNTLTVPSSSVSHPFMVIDSSTEDDELFGFGDDLFEPITPDQNDDVLLFSSDWEDGIEPEPEPYQPAKTWKNLDPKLKETIIEKGQTKAMRNKKKREPAQDKKRRMMMHFKDAQRKRKRQSRVMRPIPVKSPDRKSLKEFEVNSIVTNGTVISLTDFGVYIDVGTECDGLLHISQISREQNTFVSHPREIFSPGDIVENLYVHRVSPELKKLQLSLLAPEKRGISFYENEGEEDDGVERITLDEIDIDDELWGEIKRVTNFGAYIELGAEVDGFLHFMDHPMFGTEELKGAPPSAYMKAGQRVRVWASNVDMEKQRIKLTALRPSSLPILRREILW